MMGLVEDFQPREATKGRFVSPSERQSRPPCVDQIPLCSGNSSTLK